MRPDQFSCSGYRLSRRAFVGAAAGTFLGMNINTLVARAGGDRKQTAEHVILFWNGGGMSHIDTFDPKPGRDTQGEFEPIKTSVAGIEISEIFPRIGQADAARRPDPLDRRHQRRSRPRDLPACKPATTRAATCSTRARLGGGARASSRWAICRRTSSISGLAPKAGYLGQKCEAYFVGRPGEKDPYLAFPAGITEVRGNKRLEILARR